MFVIPRITYITVQKGTNHFLAAAILYLKMAVIFKNIAYISACEQQTRLKIVAMPMCVMPRNTTKPILFPKVFWFLSYG